MRPTTFTTCDRYRGRGRTIGPTTAALGVLLAVLVAPVAPDRARAATIEVEARDNVFVPEQLHIDPGDTVVWQNVGVRVHTVTSDTELFESGNMASGDTFSRTFPDEGFFFYHCRHHGSARNGMWGVVIVGDPPPPSGARERIVVPDDYRTIQRAVARADPHSTVVVRPGTYRESVIVRVPDLVIRGLDRFRTVLDGGDSRVTGISVVGLGDVTIRDLTVRNYLDSGIALSGVGGYTIERVDLIKNRTVGLDVTGSFGGVIEEVFVWGSGDSGIRIAECSSCSTVVRSANVRWSYLGLAAVNVTGVAVRGSRFVRNGVGIAAIGAADGPSAPGSGLGIVANAVTANNTTTIPAAGLSVTTGIPFGTGIWVAGTANAVVSANDVARHERYGILVSRSLDRQLDPRNAVVVANEIRGPGGIDLAWDGTGTDDCFEGNAFDGPTGPPSIETTYACGARPFAGVIYLPVFDDVEDSLVADPDRPQEEPPEPKRPRCQAGRQGCR